MKPFTLNIRGRLIRYDRPAVMGIVNVTPDSFFGGSRTQTAEEIFRRTEKLLADGADMIDIGAYSSRPGAEDVTPDEELRRLETGINAVRKAAPDTPLSVDTFRAEVAMKAVRDLGADIINDISGGDMDEKMYETVAMLKAPYILMHMRGTPATMQSLTEYEDVTAEVIADLSRKIRLLRLAGVSDVIADPGFGFSKTAAQNFEMLDNLKTFTELLDAPLLVGISRKSMITRSLGISSDEALNGTTVLNTIALMRGASILRVHDVREAREAVTLCTLTSN